MYNIAVLVYDLINDYNHTVVRGIYDYCKNKQDVRLIVAPINIPRSDASNYDYQFWTLLDVIQSDQIDGIIVIPNSFTNHIGINQLTNLLKCLEKKPMVSVSFPLNIKGCKYTVNSSGTAYEQVIEHIKTKHNRKRFAFFDASLIDSFESIERLESFKKALKKNNLEFYPELVFHGDFTPGTAENFFSEKLKSRDDLDFDALCCVNDFTAAGSLLLFDKVGIKCPDDVVLFGYDDSDMAITCHPRLSSINQDVEMSGFNAAKLLYETLENETTEEYLRIDSYPIFRQSCGCVPLNSYKTAFVDLEGNFHERDEKHHREEISAIRRYQNVLFKIYDMINLLDCYTPLDDVRDLLSTAIDRSDLSGLFVCLYDRNIVVNSDLKFNLPEKVRTQIVVDTQENIFTVHPLGKGKELLMNKQIIPDECKNPNQEMFFIHPVFVRNKNYGYMLCRSNTKDYIHSAINLKIISDILVNACEYSTVLDQQQELLESNLNLSRSVETDELTSLLNRRGIYEYGQKLIDLSVAMNKVGSVFFCDMDGLKTINDTYGHKMGDLAIKTEAQVLRASFREADVVGRLSGDEFCAVATGYSAEKIDLLRRKLLENNKKYSKKAKLPFTLSISVGAVGFDSKHNNLKKLLQKADVELYKEKQQKHSKK